MNLFAIKNIALLLSCISITAIAQPAESQEVPWDQRSWEDRQYNGHYEDEYTFEHGKPYVLDPWTWGYTKEFAERFHMPEQWIEPDLKGALAVAFRMSTIGDTRCGFGGRLITAGHLWIARWTSTTTTGSNSHGTTRKSSARIRKKHVM
ncbi:exported hypothetical protein [Gammaproteobacteria bacterium]